MANPATTAGRATQDERIPGLPVLPPGTDPATLSVPVYNPATDKTHQAPIGGPAAASNAIIGGPKLVQYRDSRLFGVPAGALTLDRLKPSTIVPGTLATVNNPADTPMTVTKPPKQYVATLVQGGIVGAVLVPRYIGALPGDEVPIVWQESSSTATPTAEFYKLSGGKAYFSLSPEAITKQVAGLLRRRPLIERTNIVLDPVAPLPALAVNAVLPAGLTAPGAADFKLSAKGVAAPGAPQIAEWIRGGEGGNIITISGEGLLGATAVVYAHGKLYECQVRNTASRQLQAQLPKNIGPFDVFVLWPKNANGYGEPVLLNAPEAWWAEELLVAGELFSVFGDYLATDNVLGSDNSYVGIESLVDGKAYAAEIVETKLDYVVARAPLGLATGNVKLYLHNGHGGNYTVSQPVLAKCVARGNHILHKAFPTIVDVVLDPAGTLDSNGDGNGRRIQDAVAGSNGQKTLRFPKGTFIFRDAAFLGHGGVKLLGTANSDGTAGTIFLAGAGFVSNFGFIGSTTDVDGLLMQNIAIRNEAGIDYNGAPKGDQVTLNFKRITNSAIINCEIYSPLQKPFNCESSPQTGLGIEHVYLLRNKITGPGSPIIQGRQVFIDDNVYNGASRADSLFNGSGVTEACARRNKFGDKTPGSLDEMETMKGRFCKIGMDYGSVYNCYVGDNIGTDIGPLSSLTDQNEGEIILMEGAWQVYCGAPTATTASTITFAETLTKDYANFTEFPKLKVALNVIPGKHLLRIIDGPGTGQAFHILSHDGHTVTLDRPFRVRPTAASLVQIGLFHHHISAEGNDFTGRDGVASRDAYNVQCGINFYGGGTRSNVKRNKFRKLRAGVRIDGTYEDKPGSYKRERQVLSTMFINVQGNLFDGCRRHIFLVAAQEDRNAPTSYYSFPAAAINGCRFAGNEFKNAIDLDVEIEAARSEAHSALNNGASIQNISFDGEYGVPKQPIKNYWRYYEGLPPIDPVPSTLGNLLLSPAATDVVGAELVTETTSTLGDPEPLPNGGALSDDILSFSQSGNSQLGYGDAANWVPLARTYTASAGETPAPVVDAYTKTEVDELLLDKAGLDSNDTVPVEQLPTLIQPRSAAVMVGTRSLGYIGYDTLETASSVVPLRPIYMNVPFLVVEEDMTLSAALYSEGGQILVADGKTLTLSAGAALYNTTILAAGTGKVAFANSNGSIPDASQAIQFFDARLSLPAVFSAANQVVTLRGGSVITTPQGTTGTIYLYDQSVAPAGGVAVVDRKPGASAGGTTGIDYANPIPLSAAATLQPNKAYYLTGNGYTLTLPSASANLGAAIYVEVASSAAGLYAVGTQLLRAAESLIVRATPGGWAISTKQLVPLVARVETALSQQDSFSGIFFVPFSVTVQDAVGMAALPGIIIKRSGQYTLTTGGALTQANGADQNVISLLANPGTGTEKLLVSSGTAITTTNGNIGDAFVTYTGYLEAGTIIRTRFYCGAGASLRGQYAGAQMFLTVTEIA